MFKEYSSNSAVVLAPKRLGCRPVRGFEQRRSFVADAIHHVLRAAFLVIVDLAAWALQIAVVIEQLQSPQERLGGVSKQSNYLRRSEKPMAVNQSDDFLI